MHTIRRKKSPLELAELILKHSPGASMAMIAEVISEWGDVFDDRRMGAQESIDFDSAAPSRQPQRGSLNIKLAQSVKQLDKFVVGST
jgi:hypothetical protein